MADQGNIRIARKSHARAEADFATWLMMAKLGSFEHLPADAQAFLTHYQDRLATADEKAAASTTIEEIYSVYYAQMGGSGAPPGVDAPTVSPDAKVVQLKDARRARVTDATRNTTRSPGKKPLPAFLIFIGLVLLIVALRFLTGNLGN